MARLPLNFWVPTPIRPQHALADLRAYVLARSEKRLPRWRFRIDPDLVVQIQPKLSQAFARFECTALLCEGANAKLLTQSRREISREYWRLSFDIKATAADAWVLRPTHAGWQRATNPSAFPAMRERLVAVFHSDTFNNLAPANLLVPHCLACGKALTDPVSMARMIGPECWGSGSVNLPFISKLREKPAA
jgi:hypothetical protein